MSQQEEIKLFRAPECEKIQSFLITLIDGTGSMDDEYESAVSAHSQVFDELGENQIRKQWEQKLFNFLPFRSAGSGNISNTFKTVFQDLLDSSKVYPNNITFLLISDGKEHYEYSEISDLVPKMKEKYLIQFISVAVGNSFPNSISNHLRNNIQNQNQTCPPIFSVERSNRYKDVIKQDFVDIFVQIKELLLVSKENFSVNVPVYTTLQQDKPTNFVAASQPFYIYGNQQIIIKNQQISDTNNPLIVADLIKVSVTDAIINVGAKNDANSKTSNPKDEKKKDQTTLFQQISSKTNKILGQTNLSSMPDQEQINQIAPMIQTVNLLAVGGFNLTKMNDKDLTKFQVDLENPKQLQQMIDEKEELFQLQEKDFTVEILKTQLQNNINQLMLGCPIRDKTTKKQLDQIESIDKIIGDSLQNYKKLFSMKEKLDVKQAISEVNDIIEQFLQTTLEQIQIRITTEHQTTLKKLNATLQQLDELQKETKISQEQVIETLDKCLKFHPELKQNDFVNFDETDYAYLPPTVSTSILFQYYTKEKVDNLEFFEKQILQGYF